MMTQALRGLWSGAIAASLMSPQQGETNKDNTMTTRTARLIGAANLLADSPLMDRLGDNALTALLSEETARIRNTDRSWAAYRSLSRTGSRFVLGGREKRAIHNALKMAGLI